MTADVVAIPAPDHKPFTLVVAAKVRGRMAEMGYRQIHLAQVLGVSQQSASNRLRGKTPFDVNELATVAAWLGRSVTQLLDDAGTVPPQGPGHVHGSSAGNSPSTVRRLADRFRTSFAPSVTLLPADLAA